MLRVSNITSLPYNPSQVDHDRIFFLIFYLPIPVFFFLLSFPPWSSFHNSQCSPGNQRTKESLISIRKATDMVDLSILVTHVRLVIIKAACIVFVTRHVRFTFRCTQTKVSLHSALLLCSVSSTKGFFKPTR